jgi:hypothetical protein
MNSRERLLKTLNHQEPDRIPYDLGSTQVTGIHKVAYTGLREQAEQYRSTCSGWWLCPQHGA